MPQLAGTAAGRLLAAGQGRALLGHQHSADATALPPPPAHPGSSMSAAASGTTLVGSEGSPAPAPPAALPGRPPPVFRGSAGLAGTTARPRTARHSGAGAAPRRQLSAPRSPSPGPNPAATHVRGQA
ncbi:hypothetical protein ABPG77_008695 [Micractinium sp. CCAP 211/92]